MSLQYLKMKIRGEVEFLHADKRQSGLQVDFNTLSIKVSYKVILSLLMSMMKHSQSTQSIKFVSLCNISKKVKNGVHFLHADKHQNFKVIFLQYIMAKVLQLLLCSTVM